MNRKPQRNSRSPQRIKNADGSIRFVYSGLAIASAKSDFMSARLCVNGFTRQIIRGKDQIRQQKLKETE